jgi:hypothetical protein
MHPLKILEKKLDELAESVKELESKVKFLVFCEELRQKREKVEK